MALRNFWLEASIDGRKSDLAGGPRNKEGGMEINLYQREHGESKTAMQVTCKADGDKLVTRVMLGGKLCGYFETKR